MKLLTALFLLGACLFNPLFGQSPGGISATLKVWLKADAGVEKAPGVPAANGDAISKWLDNSGSGFHYIPVAGPTLSTGALNFNPAVEILSGGFDAPVGSELSNNWTVFFISKKILPDDNGRVFDGHTGNYLWAHWGQYTNSIYLNGTPSNFNSGIATTTGIRNLHLHSYKRESVGGTLEARADGSSLTTFGSSASANGIRIDINAGAFSASESSNSQIGEMIIYNSPITGAEVDKVESYLGIKYGISLAHNYVASDGTVMWNYAANAGYNSNIAGIGRDDNSGLSQPKSLSAAIGGAVTLDKGGAFGTDKNFIVWGNNNGSGTSLNIPAGFTERSSKTWKTAVTGAPGSVSFSVDLSALGLPNTGNATNYALLIDGDGDFSSGATAYTTGPSLVGSVLSFTGVSFSDGNFFSIGISSVSAPGGIFANLAVWLEANSGPEKAPGNPAQSGDALTTWLDKSGYGHDYIAVPGPTLQGNTLNYNPSVEILSSGGFDAQTGSELGTDWTVFFISQKLASDNNGRLFDGHTGNYLWAHWNTYVNSLYLNGNPANHNVGIATTAGIQDLHLHTYKRESTGGTLEARADGTSLTTFGASSSASTIRIDIDAGVYAASEHSDARIGEMVIYNTPLSAANVNKIESYLSIKYGLTLGHNYVATDGTVLWDVTSDAAYTYDVAGIGRDDASALDQQKSMSVDNDGAVTLDKGGAFGSDKNFILWGNNNATSTSNNVPAGYILRTARIWKTTVTGAPGLVNFSIDLSKVGLVNTGSAADYALLIDTDTDFSSGATAHTTGGSLLGNILSFTGVSLSNGSLFSVAAANVSTAGGVAGTVFWVKANAGVTGTTGISNWADQSGSGNDAIQGSAAIQPSLVNNSLNFNPVIDFSDPNDVMTLTNTTLSLNTTVFTVGLPATGTGTWRSMLRGTAADLPIIVQNGTMALGYYEAAFKTGGITWTQNEPAVVSAELFAGDVNFRKNGNQGASIATVNLTGKDIKYFGNNTSGQRFGQIAETIIYNTSSPLSATEKQKIESYLAIKYGITLSHNYLASNASVIWNVATNAGYNNNITGIGRDDNSGLTQPKSQSVHTGASVTLDKGGAFSTNNSFILWGNNASTGTSANVPASYQVRSTRTWKTAVSGSPGNVALSVDLSVIGLLNTGSASDYALLIDADGDFSSGATVHTTGATLVGNILSFTGVSLSDGNFFSIAAMNVPIPGGVAGTVFWVKANAGVTGTTNVTNWADQSGTGNDATQGNGAIQPSLVNTALNFNPVIDFSDPNDVLLLTNPPVSLNTTVFTVGVPAAGTGTWRSMLRGTSADLPIIVQNAPMQVGYYEASFKTGNLSWTQNEPAVVSVEMFAGDVNFRKNGTQGASITTVNLTAKDIKYFGNNTSGQRFGQIAETMMFNTASPLTATEKQKIESYLAIKYGITLTHNYLASDGTVLWDIVTNAAYPNNIAGIGRDDAAGLSQPKSLSVNTGAAVAIDKGGAFSNNKDFILWGNDNSIGLTANAPSGFTGRTSRIWKVAVSGTPGTVSFSVDLAVLSVPVTGNAADYTLLIDTDTDFSSGSAQHTTGASLVGNILSFTGVSFSDGNFFSIGMSNVSTPGGVVGNMAIWLKADQGVEKAPGTPAGNGDAVTRWLDKSGNANHYIATAGPTLQDNTLNFNPSVQILTSGGLDAPVGSDLTSDWTLFFISQKLASDNNGRLFEGSTGNYLWAHWGVYVNGIYLNGNPANHNTGIASTSGVIDLHLHTYKRESPGGTVEARADGTSLTTFASSNSASGIRIDIDAGANAGGEHSDARVGEMIMFRTPLTGTDVDKIESYLGIKYGITLGHNYVASDGTIVWDVTANAAYTYDVAGIGRDDASSLNQLKSLSVDNDGAVTIDKGGAFGSDKTFLLWGNDNATSTSNNVPSGYLLRTARIWKTLLTGAPGSANFSVDLTKIGLVNTGSAADYALLIDTDTDFSSGSTVHTAGASLVGNILSFTGVSLSNGSLFAIAAANVPAAGGVAGTIFWVKADAGVTGTTNVSNWADQSGSGNDATQGSGAQQPSLINGILNFHPVIDFSDPNDVLNFTIPPSNLNTTVFTVAVPAINSNWRTMFRGTTADHSLIIQSGGTALGYYDNDVNTFKPGGFTWLQNEPAVVGLEMRTNDVNFRKNGAQGASITTINLTGITMNSFGNYQAGGQRFGQIAETIIFNTPSALTTTEKEKIESYLAIKYGITLTHNYLASDGTILWNIATNAGYNTNITGIGRDDNSTLNQQKSKNALSGGALTLDKGGVFSSNKDFLLWGNNNLSGTSTNVPSSYQVRSNRVWKTAVTGTPGTVNFSVDLSAIGLINTGSVADYALLIDGDGDFSAGASVFTTGASLVGNVLTFTGVSLSDGNFFAIAAMNVPIPGGVAGTIFWVKANVGVTGTTNVSNWADQSGNGNDATQGSGAVQPSLVNSVLNFNPVIDFSDPNDVMLLTTVPLSLNSTVFTVGVPAAGTGTWRSMLRGTSADLPIIVQNSPMQVGYYEASFKTSGLSWTQNEPAVVSAEMFAGDVNFRKNGTQGASITTINLAGKDIKYFGNNTSGQRFGQIAETLIYNTASPLTTTEKEKIESYLAIKYGLTLTHNYLASDGTLLWNTTTNATYQNNVAGIGRDDVAALSQPKSLSVNAGASVTINKGSTFGTNKDFLLWGNNSAAGNSTNVPAGFTLRSNRIWKVAVTGTPGAVTFSVDLSALGLQNTGSAADYALLIDTDTDFSAGATAYTTGASLMGSVLSFTGVTFSNNNFFSIGATNVTLPGGIAGGVFWVRADAGITIATGVTNWADQSGNSNDASQATGANQPALISNDLNFNPAVNFSGNTQKMVLAIPPANLNSTIFAVGSPIVNTAYRTMFRGNVNDHPVIVLQGGNTLGYYDNDNVGFKSGGFSWLQNEPAVVVLEMRTGDVNFRKNGVQGASNATINLAGLNLNNFGNYQGNGQQFGRINEAMIFNTPSALTTTEKQKVETYLGLKYGITISHDYLASDGTIVWNSTTNAVYHNNVAGIGKDVTSGLNQKQSKNQSAGSVVTIGLGSIAVDNASNGNNFAADRSFFIWGNNTAALNSSGVVDIGTTVNAEVIVSRLNRVWKSVESGTVGTLKVRFDLSTVPGHTGAGGDNELADVRLLVDADGVFASGATSVVPSAFDNATDIVEFNYDFNPGTGFYFTIGSVNFGTAPLPLELTSFDVTLVDGDAALLNWTTASELNTNYFDVERSKDGSGWESIGVVQAAGHSVSPLHYKLTDLQPFEGISYYRLHMVETTGSSGYSQPIVLSRPLSERKLLLYPNPAQSEFILEGNDLDGSSITLTNELGQNIPVVVRIQEGKVSIPVKDLPRGPYFVTIRKGSMVDRRKLILN